VIRIRHVHLQTGIEWLNSLPVAIRRLSAFSTATD
jgi:hypothetical protein